MPYHDHRYGVHYIDMECTDDPLPPAPRAPTKSPPPRPPAWPYCGDGHHYLHDDIDQAHEPRTQTEATREHDPQHELDSPPPDRHSSATTQPAKGDACHHLGHRQGAPPDQAPAKPHSDRSAI